MGLISDLYNGDIAPFENAGYAATEEYKLLVDDMQTLENLFLSRLKEEDKIMYETLVNQRSSLNIIELDTTFVNAFRLGALLMIDVYNDNE